MANSNNLNNLSIYYQNVRGLRSKTNIFYRNVCAASYDIIILTETWLLDGISDAELFDGRYVVWRRDRDYKYTGQTRGGGVLIATHKMLATIYQPTYQSTAEDLWVTLDFGNKLPNVKLHICVLYLCTQNLGYSYSNQLSNFLDKLNSIVLHNSTDKFIIAGDFNLSSIDWVFNDNYFSPRNYNSYNEILLIDEFNILNLRQYNGIHNKFNKILDLVLSNDIISVKDCSSNSLVPIDPHHSALLLNVCFMSIDSLKPAQFTKYLFNKGDYDSINEELRRIDWANEFSLRSLDECVDIFYSTFYSLRQKYIPSKLVKPSHYPKWYSPALKKTIREQYKYYRKYLTYHNSWDEQSFRILRARVKVLENKCYKDYICSVENSISSNSKMFWEYSKSRSNTNVMPSSLSYNGSSFNTGQNICDAFSEFFKSTFLDTTNNSNVMFTSSSLQTNLVSDICGIELSEKKVRTLLLGLDPSKSAGPDELPATFLIHCADAISYPILLLFNKSLIECTVPTMWKKAYITPIHKKGSRTQITNYRPISKLCIVAKVFEKVVHSQVYAAIKQSLSVSQHGFLPDRSTVSNLVLFNDFLSTSMDNGQQVDVVYTDYSKAFDRISHNRLIIKLESVGIRGDLLRWFASYIDNRSQAVVVNNYVSSWVKVPSGVPQGSLLGPLLFIIFINDIGTCFRSSQLLCFADDMKIFSVVSTPDDADSLQQDLLRLEAYCTTNSLDLNPHKCNVVTFTRNINKINFKYHLQGVVLQRENVVRDLGVIHDSKLIFDVHINNIVNRAYKSLGFVIRMSNDFKQAKTFKVLYCTLVRSILEYATQIWNPRYSTYITRIEAIQKKFLKYLCFRLNVPYSSDRYLSLCKKFHLLPLDLRRKTADLVYLHKIVTSAIDCPDLLSKLKFKIPGRVRRKPMFALPHASTNYRQNSFLYRASQNLNTLLEDHDVDLFNTGIPTLRRLISSPFFATEPGALND